MNPVRVLMATMPTLLGLLASLPAMAGDISFEAALGQLSGRAQEFVYNADGSTLSRLDWQFDNVTAFTGGVAFQAAPRLKLGARLTTNLSGGSYMDDWDYQLSGCPGVDKTCHSWHPDTKLRTAFIGDAWVAARAIDRQGFALDLLAGYKADYYFWQGIGGAANYGDPGPGVGISYEQWWTAPYVGLAGNVATGLWSLDGRVIASALATSRDHDIHHLRALDFREAMGDDNTMLQVSLALGYQWSPAVRLFSSYEYTSWGLAKGQATMIDESTGDVSPAQGFDDGGANLRSHLVSAGVSINLGEMNDAANQDDGIDPQGRFYAGIMAGPARHQADWQTIAMGDGSVAIVGDGKTSLEHTAGTAGLFAGYQTAAHGILLGLEADVSRPSAVMERNGIAGTMTNSTGSTDVTTLYNDLQASLRLRAGIKAGDRVTLYATGGPALGILRAEASCGRASTTWCVTSDHSTARSTRLGWTAGLGLETDFGSNWFSRVEYRHSAFTGSTAQLLQLNAADAITAKTAFTEDRMTLGFGYRF